MLQKAFPAPFVTTTSYLWWLALRSRETYQQYTWKVLSCVHCMILCNVVLCLILLLYDFMFSLHFPCAVHCSSIFSMSVCLIILKFTRQSGLIMSNHLYHYRVISQWRMSWPWGITEGHWKWQFLMAFLDLSAVLVQQYLPVYSVKHCLWRCRQGDTAEPFVNFIRHPRRRAQVDQIVFDESHWVRSVQWHKSPVRTVTYGVPQGSVLLGPLLSVLYTADLNTIAKRLGVYVHFYADVRLQHTTCTWVLNMSSRDGCVAAGQLPACVWIRQSHSSCAALLHVAWSNSTTPQSPYAGRRSPQRHQLGIWVLQWTRR